MRTVDQYKARNVTGLLVGSSDHITGKTGLHGGITITASKDGAAFASISPTETELASGLYNFALTASHTDTPGDLWLHITASGADPLDVPIDVQPNPNIIRSATAQAGGSSTITLDASASATDNFYRDTSIIIISGTGAGQVRGFSGYVGSTKIYSVSEAWATNPDSTSKFVIVPNAATMTKVADAAIAKAAFATDAKEQLFGVFDVTFDDAGSYSRTTAKLDSSASSVSQFYTGGILQITGGTGAGGWAMIDDYTTGRVMTFANDGLPVAPDSTSTGIIVRAPSQLLTQMVLDLLEGDATTIEGSVKFADCLRLLNAVIAGPVQDFRTGTLVFKSLDGTKTRLTVVTDASGRVSITLGDLT